MIARISGRLEEISADAAALVDVGGGLWYEIRVPACDVEQLTRRVGQDIILHTIHYFEGDPSHGQVTPRLIGFRSESDRDFLKIFTTVKGVGVRKALRALARPIAEIAAAIQAKDARFLISLPEIGKRTAEQIIVELHGKLDDFAGEGLPGQAASEISAAATEAISVLVGLGERRGDAAALVERVLGIEPDLESAEEIIQHAYKLKAAGI